MPADKIHVRYCLLFLYRLGKSASEAKRLIDEAYGEGTVGGSTCREWFAKFRKGEYELEDKPRAGRPQEFSTAQLQQLLDENPRQTTKDLAKQLGTTHSSVVRRLQSMGKAQQSGTWLDK